MVEIIQGSNLPIIVTFEEYMADVSDIHVALTDYFGNELKHWSIDDIEIDENGFDVICPLSQEDTINFIPGGAFVEVKYIDDNSQVITYPKIDLRIRKRVDKHLL